MILFDWFFAAILGYHGFVTTVSLFKFQFQMYHVLNASAKRFAMPAVVMHDVISRQVRYGVILHPIVHECV